MTIKSGIYKIQSISHPNRCYIGSAVNLHNRWATHLYTLKNNKHGNPKLQAHFNKYGIDDLQFSILVICIKEELRPINEVIWLEQFFINAYNPWFNIHRIAGSPMGVVPSEATREKLRQANIGKKRSEETRLKLSIALMGHVVSEETKKKISEGGKGRIAWSRGILFSEKQKEKMKGRIVSEETRQKLSLLATGRKGNIPSPAGLIRISLANKGKKRSVETKKKMSEACMGRISWNKGKHFSEEVKQHMKDAWVIRKQKQLVA
jgi:group I intron endonuclease